MTAAAMASRLIEVQPETRVRALLTDAAGRVRGVLAERGGALTEIIAAAVVLATGGVGGLYAVTTNPHALLGEGLALAGLAGARIDDPEFVQFHPTAIAVGADPAPLASEALRGEGARLVDAEGAAIMAGRHPLGDLAPRDIVARAIHKSLTEGRGAFLDARTAIGEAFPDQFPAVFAACMAAGLDPRRHPIPIAPAAHYHMGGIATDGEGQTTVAGLFAAGECASTGVHGANRLASNSLLEAAVFGARAGRAAAEETSPATPTLAARPAPDLDPDDLAALREAMSRDCGVVRDAAGLQRLVERLEALRVRSGNALPLVAALVIAGAALDREESRGGHFRADFPQVGPVASHSQSWLAGADGRPLRHAAE